MQGSLRIVAYLCTASALAALSGCAETAENVADLVRTPFKKPVNVANVKSSRQRMDELRKLTSTAKRLPRAEQDRLSAELSREIQYEENPAVRRQILRTLAVVPTPMAKAVLAAGLNDGDSQVRVVACQSLGVQGGEDAVQELSRIVESDTDFDVRVAAIRALGETRDKAAVAPLAQVLSDPDPALQYRVKESLRLASGRDYGDNVEAWQQYAKAGQTDAKEVNIADKMKRYFR